ncbi:MAG: hypothetical protein D8M57_04275 [Candidatus Scalindua sp. AMX11]|nr:MAG: hypothetical protein DWQ00_02160 [Candidatus Scalindua sp.]NOG84664.1 hypothetical protein [Planctomycetota bacterium]RZV92435.1 MAG: hypothetical protein EX341_05155 [Candidatus Scalindua sp. SCAELEC01]TDE66036.1 MAG: hypothetical protein D8M57_04275 [Candidatus Scalindua sp. AMX11]GJQ59007.1 MAG: hypothetical protein SCALA701_18080 [Candidatus Scalindua sp.]
MNVNHLDVIGYREDLLKKIFDSSKTLSLDLMLNSGKHEINREDRTIFNDLYWKGFFPVGHVLNFFSSNFHAGFKKRFFKEDDQYAGITSDTDGFIHAKNSLEERENDQLGKHILLKYTEIPWRGFYDIFKVISDKLLIGKVFIGAYPHGIEVFTFCMVREFTFEDMSVEDHRKLYDSAKVPAKEQIEGVWDMAAVSNNNHRTGVARLDFDVKPDGRIEGRYQFMNLVQGQTRVELTEDELQMHDFTPMHDEIRTLDNEYMIGKWCSAKKEIFGPLSAGLLHFEPTSDGQTRFCFYYTLKRSNLDRLPAPGVLDRVMRQKLGVGMTFEEEMVGRYSPGELRDSQELEPDQGVHCQFNVKIIIADLDEFIASEEHRAELNGTIQFAEFNEDRNVVCPLEDGSYFNYLRKNPDTEEREMRYHIRFKHRDKLYLFNGTKFLQKDHKGDVAEILEDYTTLYCRITQDDNHVQIGAAKLKFRTTEDIKSIASMLEFGLSFEVTGTKSLWKKISARNKMNAFTMHFIFDEYNPFGL